MDLSKVRFTAEHEWVRIGAGGKVTIGITDFAAAELGDIVYVELPKVGAAVRQGESMGTIEAVKTVADLYAPVSGTVSAINSELEQRPELVNNSPFENGWFVQVTVADAAQLEKLMDHKAYRQHIGK